MPITERMLLKCYEAFKNGDKDIIPEGMNANSAKMTMTWLDSLFSGKPYHRDGSALQYKLILKNIENDYGREQLLKAKSVLMEHCEWSLKKHNKQRILHRKILNSFN